MKNLFQATTATTTAGGNRSSQLSAEVIAKSTTIADQIFAAFTADEAIEEHTEMVKQSIQNSENMFALVSQAVTVLDIDLTIDCMDASESEVDKAIKSQQSKRSRAMAKQNTIANYKASLAAVIAEVIIRTAYNKPRGQSSAIGNFTYEIPEDKLELYREDPTALAKAIRAVQSRKSVEKAKANFTEDSERWQALLEQEATLKALRDGQTTVSTEVAAAKDELENLDITKLKASEAKEVLERLKGLLA